MSSSKDNITSETKKQIKTILIAVYSSSFEKFTPTHKTLPIIAEFIGKLATCNKKIDDLLTSLSLTNGKAVALKLISTASKMAKNDKNSFKMCDNFLKAAFRTKFEMSQY